MKNYLIKVLLFLSAIVLLPASVNAETQEESLRKLDPTQGITGGNFFNLIDDVMNRLPYFLGGLAFLSLLYSGAIYVGALGDPTKMEAAKKNLSWTAIGILAAAVVFVVIKIILWIANPLQLTI